MSIDYTQNFIDDVKGSLNSGSGGGGTVDTVARTDIAKHIDDTDVHHTTADIDQVVSTKISDIIGGAPTTMDTLSEIADALANNQTVVDALDSAIGSKVGTTDFTDHTTDVDVHVTALDRASWNAKADISDLAATTRTINDHTANDDMHVTADEKVSWNNSITEFTSHANNEDIHLTAEKAIEAAAKTISNPNLLDNPDFKINQRGLTIYNTNDIYTVDRWRLWKYNAENIGTVTVTDDGLLLTSSGEGGSVQLSQMLENNADLVGKTVTITCEVADVVGTWIIYQHGTSANYLINKAGVHTFTTIWKDVTSPIGLNFAQANSVAEGSCKLKWIKLELGSVATQFVSPNPAEELLRIQSMNDDGTSKLVSNEMLPTIMNSQMVSNPNLLINPDFKINQRGQTEWSTGNTTNVYTVDGWYSKRSKIAVTSEGLSVAWDGVNGTEGWIQQKIETTALFGRTVTFSFCVDGETFAATDAIPAVADTSKYVTLSENIVAAFTNHAGESASVVILYKSATPVTIEWAKLELGSVATPFVPPDPATELAKCQRYYYNSNTQIVFAAANTMVPRQNYYSLPVTMRVNPTITVMDATGTEGYASLRRDDTTKVAISTACTNARDFNIWATNDDFVVDSEYRLTYTASAEL